MMTAGAKLCMYVSVAMAQTQTALQLPYHTFLCIQAQHTQQTCPHGAALHQVMNTNLRTCCSKSSQTALATPLAGSDRRHIHMFVHKRTS